MWPFGGKREEPKVGKAVEFVADANGFDKGSVAVLTAYDKTDLECPWEVRDSLHCVQRCLTTAWCAG